MAGGPLPNANLVALNMAARLSDGQEVYVAAIGETPPTYTGGVTGPGTSSPTASGQLVNINTATADEMHQILHISAKTAQKIIDYRTQHGNYTSVDQFSLLKKPSAKLISKMEYARSCSC
jgi:competence protein ComEA